MSKNPKDELVQERSGYGEPAPTLGRRAGTAVVSPGVQDEASTATGDASARSGARAVRLPIEPRLKESGS
ncbi:MAG: hypothetical protein ACRD6N_01570 [Pyrinomonadaceae bacterium]